MLQVEQDKHALEILARHWPDVWRLDDVRDVAEGWPQGSRRGAVGADGDASDAEHARRPSQRGQSSGVDLIYGGFPCQDVSVAGARAGLAGERSGLWFEFERILSELRPRWAVIENVPGLLSSNSGRDFAVILAGLDKLGFDAAWAILDAQHFGVPQRRRRVFIVAGPGGRRTEQVLSLCESCGGNPETSRASGEGTTGALSGGTPGGGTRPDTDRMTFIPDLAYSLAPRDAKGTSSDLTQSPPMAFPQGVRRLTPRECERLQGFPDDWTAGLADSHRYRMMGNAVAVPVAEWIGHRLVAVDALL